MKLFVLLGLLLVCGLGFAEELSEDHQNELAVDDDAEIKDVAVDAKDENENEDSEIEDPARYGRKRCQKHCSKKRCRIVVVRKRKCKKVKSCRLGKKRCSKNKYGRRHCRRVKKCRNKRKCTKAIRKRICRPRKCKRVCHPRRKH